ncbi:MAG TPA: cobalamin-independent methionine synthase II family protein [Stellaceae bacterium]|jgi:5-methyltetrahydropteroyltriglutamate--homocysteine methyltransferase|nr:cobalamin-independent methionine synthase II family protein [Stellaceae bacterium]
MRTSSDHILTSHVGSLPRPDALIEANRARETSEGIDPNQFEAVLSAAVRGVVRQQTEIGIDVPGDGEFGKAMAQRVNYGSWWRYSWQRLGGIEPGSQTLYQMAPRRSKPGEVVLTSFGDRRDRTQFAAAYNDPESGITTGPRPPSPVCTGPLTYAGQDLIRADIANFKTALAAAQVTEGFMTAVAPASCARIDNTYYKSDEEFLYACAEAMHEEYKAIVDAGIVLQLDDPCLAEGWDQVNPEPSVEDYRRLVRLWIAALNHAIGGLPPERIRLHLCWGSWHGPHVTDIPMRDIIEVVLKANVGAISFEAGNVRHEHEWRVWQEVKLPDDKIILPGVVSHATNVVEHRELVADRICRFADIVGRERVIASTDCGLGGRIHPQIAWAKLEALVRGAELSTKRLWR